jgi:hypothetical protein
MARRASSASWREVSRVGSTFRALALKPACDRRRGQPGERAWLALAGAGAAPVRLRDSFFALTSSLAL